MRRGSGWALAGEGVRFLVRMADLLIGPVAVRRWDLARASDAEKVGFWADIWGNFLCLELGEVRNEALREDVPH